MEQKRNIYCIEGDWTKSVHKRIRISKALEFLEENSKIKTFRKDCATPADFAERLQSALKGPNSFSILYFAFHGKKGLLDLGSKKKEISLDAIEEMVDGKANGKIFHFGSCSTLRVSPKRIEQFLSNTKALAVSGYRKDIEFITSTFLDMLYFHHCQHYKGSVGIENSMLRKYSDMMKDLGFVMYHR